MKTKNHPPGSPKFFASSQILFFYHAKFQNPRITPSWIKVTQAEQRRKTKNAVNSGHLVRNNKYFPHQQYLLVVPNQVYLRNTAALQTYTFYKTELILMLGPVTRVANWKPPSAGAEFLKGKVCDPKGKIICCDFFSLPYSFSTT